MDFPKLSSEFFTKHTPGIQTILGWKNIYVWSERLIPVYEWNGHIYIALSEKPQMYPKIENAVYVMASQDDLEKYWLEFQKSLSADLPDLPPSTNGEQVADFDQINVNARKLHSERKEDILAYNDLPEIPLSNPNEPGGELEFLSEEERKSQVGTSPLTTLSQLTNEDMPRQRSINTGLFDLGDLSERTTVQFANPSGPNNEFIDSIFGEMKIYFKHSMVLLKSGQFIKPWRWNDQFSAPTSGFNNYPLVVPSPFRIVEKTLKPYHGYLVKNDVSDKFFAEWNDSVYPEHLTLAPIIIEEQLVGLLLGAGTKESDSKNALSRTEALSATISKQMRENPEKFKAAS